MRAVSSILALALAAGALAKPHGPRGGPACMNDKQAQQVATNFKDLIAAYSDELADAALTEDFTDYSDSVTELINSGCTGPQPVRPDHFPSRKMSGIVLIRCAQLGSKTFASLEEFKAGQSAQPPIRTSCSSPPSPAPPTPP